MVNYTAGSDVMENEKFALILGMIPKNNHTSVELVRAEMRLAMEAGQNSTDPTAQAKRATIPKKGKILTLEEFVDYIAKQISSPSS